MNDTEYAVLKKISDLGGDVRVDEPSKEESDALQTLVARGYLETDTHLLNNNLFNRIMTYSVTDLGRIALADHQHALEQDIQRHADAQADEERKIAAKRAQAILDKKQTYRHDFKVAAFTVILTVLVEHAPDIINLIKHALESVRLPMK